jgi:hypothetical protein
MELEDRCLLILLAGTNLGSIAEEGTFGLSALCASSAASMSFDEVSCDEYFGMT